MEPLKSFLALMRVRHTAQVVGIVLVLSIKSYGISVQSLLAITSFFFLSISLFSFDDATDYKSDMIVHPERPLARGILTIKQVYLIGASFLILGVLSAFFLMFYQFILFLIITALGFSAIFLKLGSLLRATITSSMIFLLFPFSVISLKSIFFGLIVSLPHIAGSITKDLIHLKGDEKIGLPPPAEWTRYVASIIFLISGGIILLPIIFNLVDWIYMPTILPTLISCLMLGYKVWNKHYQKVYIYGGIGMLSTLLAFAINT